MKKSQTLFLISATATALALAGCARSQDDDTDAETLAIESVVSNLNSALADGEQSPSLARNGAGTRGASHFARRASELLIPSAHAASCGLDRFSPAIGSSSCAGTFENRSVSSVLDGCTVGESDDYALSGTILLTFDASSTCDSWINGGSLPTSGSVLRTSSALSRTNPNGSVVTTRSDSHQNYLSQSVSGGVRTSFGASNRTIDILGLHRTRQSARGFQVFDHSIRTLSPVVASGTRAAGNRSITSGSVQVDHNRARYSMTTSLSGLTWTSNCCHPVSGSMSFALSGSLSGTLTADFNTGTCGEVNVTKADGSSQKIELAACE